MLTTLEVIGQCSKPLSWCYRLCHLTADQGAGVLVFWAVYEQVGILQRMWEWFFDQGSWLSFTSFGKFGPMDVAALVEGIMEDMLNVLPCNQTSLQFPLC